MATPRTLIHTPELQYYQVAPVGFFLTAEVTGFTLSNIGFQGCFGISTYGKGRISIAGGVDNNKLCFPLVLTPKYEW